VLLCTSYARISLGEFVLFFSYVDFIYFNHFFSWFCVLDISRYEFDISLLCT